MGRFGVADDVKRALDELPLHTRQFADMFRKHGSKQGRSRSDITQTDVDAVPDDLRKGWTGKSPRHVFQDGKGRRQHPARYLDENYIAAHKAKFADGGTRFYRTDSFDRYGPGNGGTTFVVPTSDVNKIIEEVGNNPRELGRRLGLGENFFVDKNGDAVPVTRADFSPTDMALGDARMPDGNEAGANDYWMPGGYLPDGTAEAVVNVDMGDGRGDFNPFKFTDLPSR